MSWIRWIFGDIENDPKANKHFVEWLRAEYSKQPRSEPSPPPVVTRKDGEVENKWAERVIGKRKRAR